jgi:hypothetical protein
MDVLRWAPSEQGVFDGAGYLSRLGGSVSVDEMEEALSVLRELGLDHATGSIHWWPRGLEHPRTQSRCSQGQGAYAWLFLERWLGIHVDALRRMVTLAPRGPVHGFAWEGFDRGRFDIAWSEAAGHVSARVTNHDQRAWTVRVGIRPSGWGTTEHLTWHERAARPGEEFAVELAAPADADGLERGWTAAVLREREAAAFGDAERIVFRRFGPATLWGHWDGARQFDPGAMPFALRFLVGNHTDEDWSDVRVRVVCPPGWRAQGRQPRHWTPDDDLHEGTVDLRLGPVAAGDRTVAPFWLRGPETWPVRFPWLGDAHGLHEDTQPGPGLLIRTTAAGAAGSGTLDATLEATTRDGRTVSRRLEVPLRVTSEEG